MISIEGEFDSRPTHAGSLIWSEDNLLALVTPGILHIFTPTLKACIDSNIAAKFFKTSTPALHIREDGPPWKFVMGESDIRHAISPLALDYMTAAWSPTSCSTFLGCMLACLTNRNQVFLYLPSSPRLEKPWKREIALDHYMMTHWKAKDEIDLKTADKIEMVSLAWSPKILIGQVGSLLTLGNKAGYIMIWHVTDTNNIQCVKSWKTKTDSWIVKLSWSPWSLEGKKYSSMLAFASADGVVNAYKITLDPLDPLQSVTVSKELMLNPLPSLHPCSVLRWQSPGLNDAERGNVLAFNKANRLHIWQPTTNTILSWRRPMAKPISEITWGNLNDRIYVFFMDGKHDVLRLASSYFVLDDVCTEYISEALISKCHIQTKTNIMQEEDDDNANGEADGGEDDTAGGSTKSRLQLHILGGDQSAHGTQLATVYCVTSPFHMEFQRDRYVSCTVVLTKANTEIEAKENNGNMLLTKLSDFISIPNSAILMNPAYHLWDLLFFLAESTANDDGGVEILRSLLRTLEPRATATTTAQTIAKREATFNHGSSLELSLQRALFENVSINSERACVFIWTQLQTLELSDRAKDILEERYATAVSRIKRHNTKSILEGFIEAMEDFSMEGTGDELDSQIEDRDQRMLLVLCDSVLLLHHSDKAMVTVAEKVYSIIQARVGSQCDVKQQLSVIQDLKKGDYSSVKQLESAREACPACDSDIMMESDDQGTCENGHMWHRCTVTLTVISDFHPRNCRGCKRKTAMIPKRKANATLLPNSTSATWLEAALRASSVCGFCGERYYAGQSRKVK
ncbi:hypothetical protein BGZ83_010208 [Gryganskiella cystojenkinii]|nr:hypothetical protein BGZ83_010208 [Gryganskiella cystojenkinii]